MDNNEKVFKWGSFFPAVEIPRDHRHVKRSKSQDKHHDAAPTSSTVSATGTAYLSIIPESGRFVDREYDIFADDGEDVVSQSDMCTKLHFWGIRPEPLLLDEVRARVYVYIHLVCSAYFNVIAWIDSGSDAGTKACGGGA